VRDAGPVLAVLGGSFNPPHLGHALLPGYLLARGDADRVLVAPCWDHPLGKSLAPFERRMSWMRLALAQYDERVQVSPIEAELARDRGGRPSYTLELLEACAARYPDARIRLVVGSDIVRSGETERWHRWDQIAARFNPIVVPRAGWSDPGAASLPEVSSTVVRAQIDALRAGGAAAEQARAALATLVPQAVAAAIERWIEGDELMVWVVGRSHVAAHVVPWLRDRGFEVAQLSARALLADPASPLPSHIPVGVWLLCRDNALDGVARALVGRLPPGTPVLHASGGRRAADVLAALAAAGHPVGTLHPICSLRSERQRSRLSTASFGVAGAGEARRFAGVLAGDALLLDINHLDARGRLAYHAACSLVANHLAVLLDRGVTVLRNRGLDASDAERALGELMLGALENLVALGVPDGVTGPLARGDRTTVEAHIAALDDAGARTLYAELSERLATLLDASGKSAK
jgi:nicotinate (nicotinamide) nucleotide adenylyltransferase